MKKNYDLSALMTYAWVIYRNKANKCDTFSEALKRAWRAFDVADDNRIAIENAIAENGITARVRTWYGWTTMGRKVRHDEHAKFQVTLETPEKGIGKTYVTSFFTYGQTDVEEYVS